MRAAGRAGTGRGLVMLLAATLLAGGALAQSRSTVRVRFVTEPFPPYTYAEAGRAAGPMAEVLRAVCRELRWDCPMEVLPWRRALAMAQRGEADGLFTVSDSPERRAEFHVSVPVTDARYTFFARAGDDFQYRDRQQLQGRTLAAYGPSGTALALQALAEGLAVDLQIEPDNRVLLRKLAAGRYGDKGLALVNESVALHLMKEEGLQGLQSAGSVKSFAYAFGLSRKSVSAARFKAFNQALYELCRSGRSAELIKPFAVPASACRKP